jgi:hypothetical protein
MISADRLNLIFQVKRRMNSSIVKKNLVQWKGSDGFESKIIAFIDILAFKKYKITKNFELQNNVEDYDNDSYFSTIIERCSCWSFLLIDDSNVKVEAKIIHTGRGKFKIVEDKYGGKYVNKIVDASDIVRCKVDI